jgi:hypothetical protein
MKGCVRSTTISVGMGKGENNGFEIIICSNVRMMNPPSGHGAGVGGAGEIAQSQWLLQDLQPLSRLLLPVPANQELL